MRCSFFSGGWTLLPIFSDSKVRISRKCLFEKVFRNFSHAWRSITKLLRIRSKVGRFNTETFPYFLVEYVSCFRFSRHVKASFCRAILPSVRFWATTARFFENLLNFNCKKAVSSFSWVVGLKRNILGNTKIRYIRVLLAVILVDRFDEGVPARAGTQNIIRDSR